MELAGEQLRHNALRASKESDGRPSLRIPSDGRESIRYI